MSRRYWGYRIDSRNTDFFLKELVEGRLRQGWGYDPGQDLKKLTVDQGAAKNIRMLEVKRGDILLVPRIPDWDRVAIVEATEDWNTGYRYEISYKEDYGHIFPARLIKSFKRNSKDVTGNIRSTLHNVSRFWNIDCYSSDIDAIIESKEDTGSAGINIETRTNASIENAFFESFNRDAFVAKVYNKLCTQLNAAEWEVALVHGLKLIYPEPYFSVERVGGTSEVYHGTDILVSMHSLFCDDDYAIAIQVKDYSNIVAGTVIQQINKADEYWSRNGKKIIDKIVIVTRATEEDNKSILEIDTSVHFIFSDKLTDILTKIGVRYMKDRLESLEY